MQTNKNACLKYEIYFPRIGFHLHILFRPQNEMIISLLELRNIRGAVGYENKLKLEMSINSI
jgi:hypothetical protein